MTAVAKDEHLFLPGLELKAGIVSEWDARERVDARDFLAVNLGTEALVLEHWAQGRCSTQTFAPGAFWLHPAGRPMQQRVYGVGSYLALLVPQDTSDLLGQSPVSILGETVTRAAPQLAQLAAVLAVEARQGNPSGAGFVYDVLGTLQSALVRLCGRADRAPGPLAALAPRQLRGVQELVESELQNGVTVAVMAKFCGLSLAYFSRVFRNTTGVAPHRFVMQRRAERARSLLLGTKLSLSEIAYRVGYADHSHFTREFRKALGVRPSSLRLMNGGGGKGAVRDSKIGSLRLSINGRAVRRSQEKTADKS